MRHSRLSLYFVLGLSGLVFSGSAASANVRSLCTRAYNVMANTQSWEGAQCNHAPFGLCLCVHSTCTKRTWCTPITLSVPITCKGTTCK